MAKGSATSRAIAEFRTALVDNGSQHVWDQLIVPGEPVAFKGFPDAGKRLEDHLRANLSAPADTEIVVVGSAKTGFSLDPSKVFAGFHAKSDVDVLIISASLFDDAWETLLGWYYPAFAGNASPAGGSGEWLGGLRKQLWRGFLVPEDWTRQAREAGVLANQRLARSFPAVRDFSARWFAAFQKTGELAKFPPYPVHGRLYRTKAHATKYHVDGLEQIRAGIIAQS